MFRTLSTREKSKYIQPNALVSVKSRDNWNMLSMMQVNKHAVPVPGVVMYDYHIPVFKCYHAARVNRSVEITNIVPASSIAHNKPLIDMYLEEVIPKLATFARRVHAKRLVISSAIPTFAEHLIDHGFAISVLFPTRLVVGKKEISYEW
jgi:hypothetical protein